MKENSINKKEVDNGIKINIPIISNQEIENTINTENLYDKIAKQIYHDREMIILQEFIKKLQKENEELNNRCRNLDKEAQAYLEELAGDNTLTRRTIKQLQEENEELKNKLSLKQFDVNIVYNDYLEKLDEYKRNTIPIQKVKDKIEEIQKVYNKLDKEVDEYINNDNKDLSKYYENKEKIGEMQTLSWCIDNLQELLEVRE